MGMGWRMTKGAFNAGISANRAISGAAQHSVARNHAQRRSRAVARGLVGPWDPIPANASDYLDYSGVATPGDLNVKPWVFPLGRYVLPKSGRFGAGDWPAKDEFGVDERTANGHAVVYAPTRSGKTVSIIAPWIYNAMAHGYLVVTLDLKGNGDLLSIVQQYAASQPSTPTLECATFDYNDPSGSVSWNWIEDLTDDSAIEAAAEAIVGRDRDNDPNREFRLRDLKWMRGLLEFARDSPVPWTVELLLGLLDDQPRFANLIEQQGSARSKTRLSDLLYLPPDDYYNRVQFLSTHLEVLNTPGFNKVTRRRQFSIDDLEESAGLFVVSAPIVDGRLSEAVSGLFLSQFLNRQLRQFNKSSRPVLFVLDEAPRLQDRLDLPRLMAVSASSGMSVLLALQEVTDFQEAHRETILSNCGTHILLPGSGEPTTKYFAGRLGTRVAARQTLSQTHSRKGGASIQSGIQSSDVPVLGRAELASPPGGEYPGVVLCYDLSRKPILVDLTRRDLM